MSTMRFVIFDPPISPDQLPDDGWYGVVYQYRNITNGKVYIGSTNDLDGRDYRHILHLKNNTHHSVLFQRAWNKYGQNAFMHEIREIVYTDVHGYLLAREQYHLDLIKCYEPEFGYNISKNAVAFFAGRTHSEETRNTIREKLTGRIFSDRHIIALKNAERPIWTQEHHINSSIAQKTSKKCVANLYRIHNNRLGKPLPISVKEKISEIKTGVPATGKAAKGLFRGEATDAIKCNMKKGQIKRRELEAANGGSNRDVTAISNILAGQQRRRERESTTKVGIDYIQEIIDKKLWWHIPSLPSRSIFIDMLRKEVGG